MRLPLPLQRRGLPLCAAICAAILALSCSSASQFSDPQNPVAQIPWPDYERLTYAMLDQTNEEQGTLILETRREQEQYILSLRFEVDTTDTIDEIELRVDAETLAPLSYRREAVSGEERITARGDYGTNPEGERYVDTAVVEDGERAEQRVETGPFAFDNDSSAWLWRSIVFEPDHELTYRSVNVYRGRSQLVQLAVRGQDTLRGPDGDVVVWQVVVTPGVEISRAWYETTPPHRLIRWDQQPRRFILREASTTPPP